MKVLGIRYCQVAANAAEIADFLGKRVGLPERDCGLDGSHGFAGAVFPAGDSWIELWPKAAEMPEMVMLQIVVDDADAWAGQARANGLDPQGPMDAHGERIYMLTGPGGLQVSIQSAA